MVLNFELIGFSAFCQRVRMISLRKRLTGDLRGPLDRLRSSFGASRYETDPKVINSKLHDYRFYAEKFAGVNNRLGIISLDHAGVMYETFLN